MIEPEKINYIDFEIMKEMCHPIAVALFDSDKEPMPKFSDHERALLESALNNPRQGFGGADMYSTFTKKVAVLYYGIIKNHAFKNGNKRTATATLLVFLFINNFWIDNEEETEDYLVTLAKRVADSKGSERRGEFLSEIELWLDTHMRPRKEGEE
ncbi:MAG: hypothetical protein A2122_01430 [Candidatus Liptonbacteria bacterium GWB1_49_6]|uniref:Fido domain-containing protein n=1 Tax=Candidatus Liptonbacteria bacterium GWB1_49_6 TaxID=1798644 RepID=A0A1G2C694_9BACT|nr:MAG: hypothetical protein A2122_01430 [Candidatus Liptonbacteria bacterium GWB1_49_6]